MSEPGDVSVPWDIEDHGLYCGESTIGQGKGVFASGRGGTKINDGSMRVVFPSIVSQAPQKKRHIEALAIIGYNRPRVGEPRERLLDNCRLLFIFSGEDWCRMRPRSDGMIMPTMNSAEVLESPVVSMSRKTTSSGRKRPKYPGQAPPRSAKLPSISALESLHDRTGSLAPHFSWESRSKRVA